MMPGMKPQRRVIERRIVMSGPTQQFPHGKLVSVFKCGHEYEAKLPDISAMDHGQWATFAYSLTHNQTYMHCDQCPDIDE